MKSKKSVQQKFTKNKLKFSNNNQRFAKNLTQIANHSVNYFINYFNKLK